MFALPILWVLCAMSTFTTVVALKPFDRCRGGTSGSRTTRSIHDPERTGTRGACEFRIPVDRGRIAVLDKCRVGVRDGRIIDGNEEDLGKSVKR